MREILFRGKPKNDGDFYFFSKNWKDNCKDVFVYGSLVVSKNRYYICVSALCQINSCINNGMTSMIEVIPETVGQYTGLTDKNGTTVFEGDIVKNDWCFACGYSVIKFGQYKPPDMTNNYQQGHLGFYLEHIHEADKRSVRKDILYFANNCEVIGNIHDNPELLKECDGE